MTAFKELDWKRIDLTAIVANGGLATIEERRRPSCRNWLTQHGYSIHTLDCSPGLNTAVTELGRMLNWEAQFGYALKAGSRNLDALRDGFEFDIPENGGHVFEILRPDIAFQEDPRWLNGLLSIAMEHSRQQLALGHRFFALLVIPEQSPFIGTMVEESRVPLYFLGSNKDIHEFSI